MASDPLFSIIIPTYNRAHLVVATIDSVLAQSFRDFEVIVVDDGSTDRTPEVLQSFGEKITVIRQENRGAEAARHVGANEACGEYLALLDSDDLLLADALATYARILRSGEMPALIIARLCRFHDGEPIPAPTATASTIEVLKYKNYFSRDRALFESCSQLLIRRTIAAATDALRPQLTAFPLESCDYMLALGAAGACFAIQHPATVAYRYHSGNISGDLEYQIRMAHRLLNLARSNAYQDKGHILARYANLGGIQFSHLRRSLRSRRVDLALRVIWDSWPMLLAAVVRKVALQLRRKARPLTITLNEPPA